MWIRAAKSVDRCQVPRLLWVGLLVLVSIPVATKAQLEDCWIMQGVYLKSIQEPLYLYAGLARSIKNFESNLARKNHCHSQIRHP